MPAAAGASTAGAASVAAAPAKRGEAADLARAPSCTEASEGLFGAPEVGDSPVGSGVDRSEKDQKP